MPITFGHATGRWARVTAPERPAAGRIVLNPTLLDDPAGDYATVIADLDPDGGVALDLATGIWAARLHLNGALTRTYHVKILPTHTPDHPANLVVTPSAGATMLPTQYAQLDARITALTQQPPTSSGLLVPLSEEPSWRAPTPWWGSGTPAGPTLRVWPLLIPSPVTLHGIAGAAEQLFAASSWHLEGGEWVLVENNDPPTGITARLAAYTAGPDLSPANLAADTGPIPITGPGRFQGAVTPTDLPAGLLYVGVLANKTGGGDLSVQLLTGVKEPPITWLPILDGETPTSPRGHETNSAEPPAVWEGSPVGLDKPWFALNISTQ